MGEIEEALRVFEDPNATTDLANAMAAVEHAVEAAGFVSVRGKGLLEQKSKDYFGAAEGSVGLEKLLEFMLQLHTAEEDAATVRLCSRFAIAGVEAPAAPNGVKCRQISHAEWMVLVKDLCEELGHCEDATKALFEQVYWKSTMNDGSSDLSVGSFVAAMKEAHLHRRVVGHK